MIEKVIYTYFECEKKVNNETDLTLYLHFSILTELVIETLRYPEQNGIYIQLMILSCRSESSKY